MRKLIKRWLFLFITIGSVVMCTLSFQHEYWLSGILWFINSWLWFNGALENEHEE